MEYLFIIFGIWVFTRISRLEKKVLQLEAKLKAHNTPKDYIHSEIIADKKLEEAPPIYRPAYVATVKPEPEVIKSPTVNKRAEYETLPPASDMEQAITNWLMRSFTGGRLFVTLGLLLLFIGIIMFLKYTAQFMVFPIELRFLSVAAGAAGIIYFGHKQIDKRRDYGLYLIGGGLGILFLTIFVAFKFYFLLPPDLAFLLMAAVGMATFYKSVKYDSMAMAILATTGGFLTPLLASTNQGSHITLFSYYLLLNLVIFAIAWKKSWRALNSVGFAFTFVIGLAWGGKYYIPEFYQSVQTFLIIYFLLYVGIGILFASRDEPDISVPIDAASIFGVPLIGFGLQLALVKNFPDGNTMTCLALGTFYIAAAALLHKTQRPGWKMLSEIFAWLSALFFTLAIPFALDARTTAPLWAMEGAAMLWMMNRSGQKLYGYSGIILLGISNLFIFKAIGDNHSGGTFLQNPVFVPAVIMSVAYFMAAYFLHPKRSKLDDTDTLATIASAVGIAWWFCTGANEIHDSIQFPYREAVMLVFYSISALAAYIAHVRHDIPLFDKPIKLVMPGAILFTIINILHPHGNYHPLQNYGYIAYAVSFFVHYLWLWKNRSQELDIFHTTAYVTFILLCGFELGYYMDMAGISAMGRVCGWMLSALAGTALLVAPRHLLKWPLTILSDKCQSEVAKPLLVWSVTLCLFSFILRDEALGRYIPIFNVTDLMEILTIITLVIFYMRSNIQAGAREKILLAALGLTFIFINALLLRFLSSHLGLNYQLHEMLGSVIVQTSLTILWTLASMAAMLMSSRNSYRAGWFAGASLLGIVVAKLFFIDLANVGTISRIVSFMGVGLLTIALGYFSPLPPQKK